VTNADTHILTCELCGHDEMQVRLNPLLNTSIGPNAAHSRFNVQCAECGTTVAIAGTLEAESFKFEKLVDELPSTVQVLRPSSSSEVQVLGELPANDYETDNVKVTMFGDDE